MFGVPFSFHFRFSLYMYIRILCKSSIILTFTCRSLLLVEAFFPYVEFWEKLVFCCCFLKVSVIPSKDEKKLRQLHDICGRFGNFVTSSGALLFHHTIAKDYPQNSAIRETTSVSFLSKAKSQRLKKKQVVGRTQRQEERLQQMSNKAKQTLHRV